MAKNPFCFKELPTSSAFCDRRRELKELLSYAENGTNVVLFSPRRYGKTSLVRRVQAKLQKQGSLTAFCDFFGVTSVEEVAARIAKSIYSVTHKNENLFQKAIQFITSFRPVLKAGLDGDVSISVQPAYKTAGKDLLDETMKSLEQFIQHIKTPIHIAFDEFQELIEVEDSISVEGILRHYIQRLQCSFFFIGSRRRLLLEMFNQRSRPFFQSAMNYELKPLPEKDVIKFIQSQFKKGEKIISSDNAKLICSFIDGHSYYMQKFSYILFNITKKEVDGHHVLQAYEQLIESEKYVFESIVQGLSNKQTALMTALAWDIDKSIYSADYISKHHLGSVGGVQRNIQNLSALDLIEKSSKTSAWQVVDPIFKQWLKQMSV